MALTLKELSKRRPIGRLSAKEQVLLEESRGLAWAKAEVVSPASKECAEANTKVERRVVLPWQDANDFEVPEKGGSLKELEAIILRHHQKIMKLEESLADLQAQLAQLKKTKK
ncbi:MAG: hypothetical protein R3C42_10025 [Parvularculaceae bacterium]